MRSKKYLQILKLIDPKKIYPLDEAIDLVKKTSIAKFDASLEVHVRLGINTEKGGEQVRNTVTLPYGSGKTMRVAAFVESNLEKEAKEAGADLVGGEELANAIAQTKKCDFDIAIATPSMMPKMAKIAKILGPKGLMPNPKNDTVTQNIQKTVNELKKGKLIFKNDKGGNIHVAIGKISFDNEKLKANFQAFFEVLKKTKPPTSKGLFIKNITFSATMGPAIRVMI